MSAGAFAGLSVGVKVSPLLISLPLVFVAGYLSSSYRGRDCQPAAVATPRPPPASWGRPLAGYFKEAEKMLVSYQLGKTPRKTTAIPFSPGDGEILAAALAADLAAGPAEGRLYDFPDHTEIALTGSFGMVRYSYGATAGAASISIDGSVPLKLSADTFNTELFKLLRLRKGIE